MFKNPFSFNGRIRRMEFGLSIIIYYVILYTTAMLSQGSEQIGPIIMFAVVIPLIWFMLAQATKRCHDLGRSGWWQLIPFYALVLLFSDGDQGRNEYGSNPKFPEEVDVLESETLDGHLKN